MTGVCHLLVGPVKSSTSSSAARGKVCLVILTDIRHRLIMLLPLQAKIVRSELLRIFTLESSFSSSTTSCRLAVESFQLVCIPVERSGHQGREALPANRPPQTLVLF